jgi:hypothetical protein
MDGYSKAIPYLQLNAYLARTQNNFIKNIGRYGQLWLVSTVKYYLVKCGHFVKLMRLKSDGEVCQICIVGRAVDCTCIL